MSGDGGRPCLDLDDLPGRWAVVTGAAHGIGEGIARRLIDVGARVIAIDRNKRALFDAYREDECVRVVADVGEPDVGDLADRLLEEYGPVQLIVNNVATGVGRTFLQLDQEHLERANRVNLTGPVLFTKRLVEALIAEHRGGSVLFVSSLHDTFVRLYPAYSMGKASVAMLTKEMAYELAPYGIRVNAISPGWVETAKPGERCIPEQHAVQLIPAGRFGEPDDIARMAIVLLSDAWSAYVTGVNLIVDGGLALHNWLMDV